MAERDKEKKKEYDRRYREKHKDRLNKQKREYYKENKDKINARNKRYREENKEVVKEGKRVQYREYKKQWVHYIKGLVELKCSRCGYDKSFAALDFHHTRDKLFHIPSRMMKALTERTKKEVADEIKKCIVLCANCHRELHETQDYLEPVDEYKI